MQFAALNKEPSENTVRPQSSGKKTRPTREAQVSCTCDVSPRSPCTWALCLLQECDCLKRYHEAMRLQQDGHMDGARALYQEILGSKVMDEVRTTHPLVFNYMVHVYTPPFLFLSSLPCSPPHPLYPPPPPG